MEGKRTGDQLIIGYDSNPKDDITVLMVARKHNRGVSIIKKITNEDAKKLYEILTQPDQHIYNLAEYFAERDKKEKEVKSLIDKAKRREEVLKENGISPD